MVSKLGVHSRWLLMFLVVGIFFIFWMSLVVLPILRVELKYRTLRLFSHVFHTTSVKNFFVPQLADLTFQGNSKYRDYGISIPSIYLDEKVIFNVDPNDKSAYSKALKRGIAHASGTSFPGQGKLGYYFAHSSTPQFKSQLNAVFYLLGKLKKGDDIYVWYQGEKYWYQVSGQRVVSPTDLGFLDQKYKTETIVLQTCWPPGTTKERLLVFAERVKK